MYLMLFLMLLGLAFIAAFEVPLLLKRGDKKGLMAFAVSLGLAGTVAALQILRLEVPSPTSAIIYIIEAGASLLGGGA